MDYFFYFIVAFFLSALGTVPVGLITLTITKKTLDKGRNSGILAAFGATIPEFIYTFTALKGIAFFAKEPAIEGYIKNFSIVLFIGLGIYYFLKKESKSKPKKIRDKRDFFDGFVIGLMNLLIIPFWLFVGVWLQNFDFVFEENIPITIFSVGAALGALAVFYVYIFLAESVLNQSEKINYYSNKIMGVLLLGLGIYQLVNSL